MAQINQTKESPEVLSQGLQRNFIGKSGCVLYQDEVTMQNVVLRIYCVISLPLFDVNVMINHFEASGEFSLLAAFIKSVNSFL